MYVNKPSMFDNNVQSIDQYTEGAAFVRRVVPKNMVGLLTIFQGINIGSLVSSPHLARLESFFNFSLVVTDDFQLKNHAYTTTFTPGSGYHQYTFPFGFDIQLFNGDYSETKTMSKSVTRGVTGTRYFNQPVEPVYNFVLLQSTLVLYKRN